ncbi:MAG: hypothetical protein RSB51_04605 [Clostridia bacterium]
MEKELLPKLINESKISLGFTKFRIYGLLVILTALSFFITDKPLALTAIFTLLFITGAANIYFKFSNEIQEAKVTKAFAVLNTRVNTFAKDLNDLIYSKKDENYPEDLNEALDKLSTMSVYKTLTSIKYYEGDILRYDKQSGSIIIPRKMLLLNNLNDKKIYTQIICSLISNYNKLYSVESNDFDIYNISSIIVSKVLFK